MNRSLICFFIFFILSLTAWSQPVIVMSQDQNAGVKVRAQASVVGYCRGEELLLLEFEVVATRPLELPGDHRGAAVSSHAEARSGGRPNRR